MLDQEPEEEGVPRPRLAAAGDPVKELLGLYVKHLENRTVLNPTSVKLHARIMADLFKHSLDEYRGKEEHIDGNAIARVFQTLGEPHSFLRRKDDSLSATYSTKILNACLRLVDMVAHRNTEDRWYLETPDVHDTEVVLKNLLNKYKKLQKQERATSREMKEGSTLKPSEVNDILNSALVKPVLEKAAESLDDEPLRASTVR